MAGNDTPLDAAIAAEERDLLRRIGDDDPGHVDQALSLLGSRTGWVSGVLLVTQAVMFIAGVWTGWRFFGAEDTLTALHWGIPSAILLIMALMLKLALWPAMQTHRLLRALKRVELMVIQQRAD